MINQFSRTELLLGKESLNKLKNSHVAIFGIGGVGSFTAEAIARSGIGSIDLIDNDKVSLTNLNRQLIALHSTIGQSKVEVMKKRILDINPECNVKTFECFYLPATKNNFNFQDYDYVIDAVDTVTAKIQLILQANESGIPIISSMGTGNKLNPLLFEVTDIYKTSVCPLARVMRQECKKRGIKKVKVLYSKEKPIESSIDDEEKKSAEQKGKAIAPGSISFVPSVAGLIIAGEVIKDLISSNTHE